MDLVRPEDQVTVEVMDGVFLTQLAAGEHMSIQHLRMEPGASVPEHAHHHEQLGFVYQGTQTMIQGDDRTDVDAGESYALASDEPHGAENRKDETCLAIDIFSPPRPAPDWAE